MGRLKIVIILVILVLTFVSCSSEIGSNQQNIKSDDKSQSSKIENNPIPQTFGINPASLPKVVSKDNLNFDWFSIEMIYGFSGKDISNKNFSKIPLDFMSKIAFDTDSIWCPKNELPKGYSPALWLETGKDPGLQIRKLHEEGYTGKGISVAIIDKPMIYTHQEIKDNIIYTETDNQSENGYVYWGKGGLSWSIPYFAGLCALGLEVDPTLTFEKMRDALIETKIETADGHHVINPVDYIKRLERLKNK